MKADRQFNIRVNEEDLKHIRYVAERMQRGQGDVVKAVFRELYKIMKENEDGKKLKPPQ